MADYFAALLGHEATWTGSPSLDKPDQDVADQSHCAEICCKMLRSKRRV